jgi:hypothetical protein
MAAMAELLTFSPPVPMAAQLGMWPFSLTTALPRRNPRSQLLKIPQLQQRVLRCSPACFTPDTPIRSAARRALPERLLGRASFASDLIHATTLIAKHTL